MISKPSSTDTVVFFDREFSHGDIYNVVDDFYTQVSKDELLKVPFGSVDSWPEHIDKLTHFWWLRLGGKPYSDHRYNPVLKHFERGFTRPLLARWLGLFKATMTQHLSSEQAQLWGDMADRMGQSLAHRNEMLHQMESDS